MIILFSILWFVSGIYSFVFWYTKDYDLKINDLLMCSIIGFLGPFAFVLGFFIHNDLKLGHIVLMKRKK